MPTLSDLESNMQRTLSKARLKFTCPPHCQEISLALFDARVLEGPIPHEEAQAIVAEPAYWSFCWASGQALASFILKHPSLVANKSVLDMGSGSGVVAIAAAKAGASKVWACDIDKDALAAIQVNAEHNKVELLCVESIENVAEHIDLITAADVLYDRDNHPLLDHWRSHTEDFLLADSRVKTLPSEHFKQVDQIESRTWPDLNEFEEFNLVRIYQSV